MAFKYNQESAMSAGGAVRNTGKYVGRIKSAVYGSSRKGTKYLELTFESQEGSEFKFLTLYYEKADGTEVKSGASMINAIMGLTGVQQLTEQRAHGYDGAIAPELTGKPIGLLLQKVLYTKNDLTDGYKFEIRLPFNCKTGQTLKEVVSNSAPKTVDLMAATLQDKDERENQPSANSNGFGGQHQGTFNQPNQGGFQQPQGGFNQPQQQPQQQGFRQPPPQSPQQYAPPAGGFDDFDDDIAF